MASRVQTKTPRPSTGGHWVPQWASHVAAICQHQRAPPRGGLGVTDWGAVAWRDRKTPRGTVRGRPPAVPAAPAEPAQCCVRPTGVLLRTGRASSCCPSEQEGRDVAAASTGPSPQRSLVQHWQAMAWAHRAAWPQVSPLPIVGGSQGPLSVHNAPQGFHPSGHLLLNGSSPSSFPASPPLTLRVPPRHPRACPLSLPLPGPSLAATGSPHRPHGRREPSSGGRWPGLWTTELFSIS